MGEVIYLAERRAAIQARSQAAPTARPRAFFFDLTCPFSYLDADRLERTLGAVTWCPAPAPTGAQATRSSLLRGQAERLAEQRRLPLSWPERYGQEGAALHRVAAYAVEAGAGGRFALAALRLAFAGGYGLADPLLLAEAAAAAGLDHERCLDAVGDPGFDQSLADNRLTLTAASITHAPAIRVGGDWFAGEHGLEAAGSALYAPLSELGTLA